MICSSHHFCFILIVDLFVHLSCCVLRTFTIFLWLNFNLLLLSQQLLNLIDCYVQMAQACGGLPIALRTFAGAMPAIQDADEWRYMYKYLQARLPLSREQFADLLHNIRHW